MNINWLPSLQGDYGRLLELYMLLHEYLASVRRAIEKIDIYGYAETIDIREEVRSGKQAILKVYVMLVDGTTLHGK